MWVVAPLLSLALLVTIYAIKLLIDRSQGIPLGVSAFGPLPLFLGAVLQLDSARAHLTGTVEWKGRGVG